MKNIGDGKRDKASPPRKAPQRFIEKDTPWAHLDVAQRPGRTRMRPCRPKARPRCGVRLLDRLKVADTPRKPMTEIRFYHLTLLETLEQVLPEFLEKTLERGQRAVVHRHAHPSAPRL